MNRRTGRRKAKKATGTFTQKDGQELLQVERELHKHTAKKGKALSLGAIKKKVRQTIERHYEGGCPKSG